MTINSFILFFHILRPNTDLIDRRSLLLGRHAQEAIRTTLFQLCFNKTSEIVAGKWKRKKER